jgi:excisionase family DNA binding protein
VQSVLAVGAKRRGQYRAACRGAVAGQCGRLGVAARAADRTIVIGRTWTSVRRSSKLVGRFSALGSLTIMAATKPTLDAPAPAAAPLSPLLDATEAGRLLSVPASWVLAEARANRIPHVRLGRYVRFSADDLEEWWRARMRGPWRTRAAASRTARSLLVDRQAEHGRRPD